MSAEGALRDGDAAGFDLIETMRWEPAAGFVRLDRHLARLYASAAELGFACDPARVGEALAGATSAGGAKRVRLVLSRNGDVSAAAQPFEPLPADRTWRLKIARTAVDSDDRLLRHKTSRRAVYQHARSEFLVQQADEVLLLNQRGELCEGTITTLFVDRGDGILLTPALDCGLLAGVLRGELLDEGKAKEATILPDDLHAPSIVYVGNSLRGLIRSGIAAPKLP